MRIGFGLAQGSCMYTGGRCDPPAQANASRYTKEYIVDTRTSNEMKCEQWTESRRTLREEEKKRRP